MMSALFRPASVGSARVGGRRWWCSAAVVGVVCLASCRNTPAETRSEAAGRDGSAGSGVEEGAVAEGSSEGSASLAGRPAPAVVASAQVCVRHEDCRVYQPGDWNARVACCYEYGCALDYVAVNQATWQSIRDWQGDNGFDCANFLQSEGPCNSRTQRCGLMQDPPAAACSDGVCSVALPEVWPVVDRRAQRCTARAECEVYHPASAGEAARCCGVTPCDDGWVAINRDTRRELDAWFDRLAGACDGSGSGAGCPSAAPCAAPVPVADCRGGECVLE